MKYRDPKNTQKNFEQAQNHLDSISNRSREGQYAYVHPVDPAPGIIRKPHKSSKNKQYVRLNAGVTVGIVFVLLAVIFAFVAFF